jgi:gliding motility-associated-like protein
MVMQDRNAHPTFFAPRSVAFIAMLGLGFLTLGIAPSIQAQIVYDLDLDVVQDTVLYDGFADVPPGFRRYKIYAVMEDPADEIRAIAADDIAADVIPPFYFNAACGCYNNALAGHFGININAPLVPVFPEIAFDTWWTIGAEDNLQGSSLSSTPGIGLAYAASDAICTVPITDQAIFTTPPDEGSIAGTDLRILIGQITTCDEFEVQVCVNYWPEGVAPIGELSTRCTDGPWQVTDMCAQLIDPAVTVLQEIDCSGVLAEVMIGDGAFPASVEYSVFQILDGDTIAYSPPSGDDTINLPEGEYYVAIVDVLNGCRDTTDVFSFVEPPYLDLSATLAQDNLCGDIDIAQICVEATGGTGELTFNAHHDVGLDIAPTDGCFSALSCFLDDGTYTISVTDENLCISDTVLVISCPDLLVLEASATEVTCTGYSDAAIAATAEGGTGPLTLTLVELENDIIGSPPLSFDLGSLPSGTYTFELEDGNGCTVTEQLIVIEPEGLSVIYALSDVECAGQCNGLLLADIQGGELPYVISVTDLDGNDVNAGALCPGNYIHTTSDDNLCNVVDTMSISGPDTIFFSVDVTNVPCSGQDAGTICVDSLVGGTGPLTTELVPLPAGGGDDDCFNVPAGFYQVFVVDSLGCASNPVDATVIEPGAIVITPTITPVSCIGDGDGSVIVAATGGSGELSLVSPFIFTLPDTLIGLPGDSMMLVVGDPLGCIDSLQIVIPEPDSVLLMTTLVQDLTCGGDCSGAIELAMNGGTGDLQLFLDAITDSTGISTDDLIGLCSQDYALYLVDANGCADSITVPVAEPAPLLFEITVQNVTCTGMDDGVAIITTVGGTGPAEWSFTAGAIDVLNLFEGEYPISGVDSMGCAVDSVLLVIADIETDMVVEIFTSPVSCWQTADGTATAAVTGGAYPIQYVWSDPLAQASATAIGLSEDTYSLVVTDDIGCTLGFLATVEPTEDCLFVADALTPNGDGINDTWVVGGLEFFPGSEVTVYNRWGQLIFRSVQARSWWDGTMNGSPLPAADYYYVITVDSGTEPLTGTVTLKY